MVTLQDIRFQEGELLVKTLCEPDELEEAYRLRHKVFSQNLKWVPSSEDELEVDPYDALATSIGLLSGSGRLLGMFRLLSTQGPFMLEKEFRSVLLPGCSLRKEPDTVEITRLTVDPSLNEKGLSSRMMLVLFKGVYLWSIGNHIRYLYMVVEKRFLRVLRAIGFPCEPISPPKSLPPAGALSLAAMLDWEQFRSESARKRPDFLDWINSLGTLDLVGEEGLPSSIAGVAELESKMATKDVVSTTGQLIRV
jgi:acyl homoserine lactone synthase